MYKYLRTIDRQIEERFDEEAKEAIKRAKEQTKHFIYFKLSEYIEPTRKGTPKGDPIGFSKKKYEASLHMIFDYKISDLAKELNISYGLLKKWRTELEFKKTILNNLEEFRYFLLGQKEVL